MIILLFAAFVSTGCTGGGSPTDEFGDQAIAVNNIQVQPKDITAGSNVRIRMSLSNVGEIPAEVQIGNEEAETNKGSKILSNACPDIFEVTEFSASTSNNSDTEQSYSLAPGYKARLNWKLSQNSGDVPLNGYTCKFSFKVPFDYSVEAFRQIQVKENPDVPGAENLFAKSSKGPMKLTLESIGSSSPSGAPVFLDDDSAEILVQLENKNPSESSYTGTVELGPPRLEARGLKFDKVDVSGNRQSAAYIARYTKNIDAKSVLNSESAESLADEFNSLNPRTIREIEDKEDNNNILDTFRLCPNPKAMPDDGDVLLYQGRSKVFRCGLNWSDHSFGIAPSLKAEIYAKANYTYVKNVGRRTVNVEYRGN
jgi:hypothetical protein